MVSVRFVPGDDEDVLEFSAPGDRLEVARADGEYAVTRRGVGSAYNCIDNWQLHGETLVLELSQEGRAALQMPSPTELVLDAAGVDTVRQHLPGLLS